MKCAYSIKETLNLVPFGLTKLYEAINRGELPARKFGRKTIILHNDLTSFLESLPCYEVDCDGEKNA